MNKHILQLLILVSLLCTGTQKLWAFDRHAKPSFTATWYLTQTAPEYNALPKGNPTLSGRGDRDDISAGSKFLWYLFRADSNNGYDTDELHNKYHLDSLTIVYDYNEYLKYLHNFTYTSRYDYLDNNDLKGMKSYISKVYSKDTVWNNWLFTIGD
jgi:hypothetical protein